MSKIPNAQAGLQPASIVPVGQGMMARLGQAMQVLRGRTQLVNPDNAWFGPGQPINPVAPPSPDNTARQFDYPSYSNTNYHKKPLEGVPYSILHGLADNYDLLRLLIETRKGQLSRLQWSIAPRDDSKPDKRCDAVTNFLQSPDQEHDWQTWVRMIVEEMLVTDATTIYPRMTKGGDLYALEVLDGATISRVIDAGGRTPLVPDPAYQQIIKGVPMCDYTRDELIYRPRNVRARKLYGFSNVEQVAMMAQTAISRQLYQLQYYTAGSTPDLIMAMPETWQIEQIKIFEEWWNSKLLGNTQARSGTMFVPGGIKPIDTKERALTDAFDQYLARIMCYCFGISVQPFVSTMNRATAQTANDQAKEEGIGPDMAWFKSIMDLILTKYFGFPDLEFQFADADETDPAVKNTIWEAQVKTGACTLDEWRDAIGLEPLDNGLGKVPMIYTSTGAVLLEDVINPPEPPTQAPLAVQQEGTLAGDAPTVAAPGAPATAAPAAKLAEALAEIDRLQKLAPKKKTNDPSKQQVAALKKPVYEALKRARSSVVAQYAMLGKASSTDDGYQAFLDSLQFAAFDSMRNEFVTETTDAAEESFTDVIVEIMGADDSVAFGLANTRAQQIAADRAGELIGSDGEGGELADSTRLMIRGLIEQAFSDDWTSSELSDNLEGTYGFSEDRADVIADTEMRMAIGSGAIEGARATGVVTGKQWLLSNDADTCDECEGNADQDVIDIDDDFDSGDDTVPAHPSCRCVVVFLTADDEEEGEDS